MVSGVFYKVVCQPLACKIDISLMICHVCFSLQQPNSSTTCQHYCDVLSLHRRLLTSELMITSSRSSSFSLRYSVSMVKMCHDDVSCQKKRRKCGDDDCFSTAISCVQEKAEGNASCCVKAASAHSQLSDRNS